MSAARSPFPAVKICGVTREEDARLAAELGTSYVGLNFWSRSSRAIDPRRAAAVAAAARTAGAKAVVGVFVNEDRRRIGDLMEEVGLDLVQLHGDEPAELVAAFGPQRIEVVRADRLGDVPSERDNNSNYLKRFQLGGGKTGAVARFGVRDESPVTQDAAMPVGSRETPGRTGPFLDLKSVRRDRDATGRTLPFAYLIDVPKDSRYGGTGESWGWASAREWIASRSRPVWIAGGLGPGNVVPALRASGAAGVDVASGVERSPGIKDPEKMKRMFEELRRATA